MQDELIIDGYISTNHWVINENGFKSIINIFNYYGYAFKNHNKDETDAVVYIDFFDSKGDHLSQKKYEVHTGKSIHIDTYKIVPNFKGLVSVKMIPNGKMKRLSPSNQSPISTSYFMLYERYNKFRDFSHELYPIRKKYSLKQSEWMTLVYLDEDLETGCIIMNNCPLNEDKNAQSDVKISILDKNFQQISKIQDLKLNSGGSKLINLSEKLKKIRSEIGNKSIIISVNGTNIEQPMSINYHKTGDFNIHHF